MKLKKLGLILAVIMAFMLVTATVVCAQEEEIDLLAMTGGIELGDMALYDAKGITRTGLISNSEMSVEVLVRNTRTTSRNYCVVAAVYADDGTMHDIAMEKGRFAGNASIDQAPAQEWMKNVSLTFSVPEVTEKTALKVMLFEAPELLKPEGSIYYLADKNSVYKCVDGLKIDIERADEVFRVEGIVEEVPFNDYVYGYDSDATPTMRINGFRYFYDEYGIEYREDYFGTVDCSLINADSLLGKNIVAYIGEDVDEETGNIMVYAAKETEKKNVITKISYNQLVDASDRGYNVAGLIAYRKPGETMVTEVEIDYSAKVFVNFSEERGLSDITTSDLASYLLYGGFVELISNDSDEKIDYIIVTVFEAEAVIEKVIEEDGVLYFDCYYGSLDDVDKMNKDQMTIVYKDGKRVTASELAANDSVSIVPVSRDVTVLYASSRTVAGSIISYDEDTVTIGDVDYWIGQQFRFGLSSSIPTEGIFFIDVTGTIIHAEIDKTKLGNYGIVLAVAYESGISDGYVMQVMMHDGNVYEYDLASKVTYTLADGRTNLMALAPLGKDDVAAAMVASAITGTTVTPAAAGFGKCELQSQYAKDAMFRFTVKNGEITKIREVENTTDVGEYSVGNNKRYDAEYMTYGAYEFDEDTIFFAISEPKGAAAVTDNGIAVGGVSSFLADGDDNLNLIFFTESGCDAVTFAIGFDLSPYTIRESSTPVIVSKTESIPYDDDEAVRVFGIQAGEPVNYIIYNKDCNYSYDDPWNIKTGDVILTSTPNIDGVVGDFKKLLDADARSERFTLVNGAELGDAYEDVFNTVGSLTDATGSKFFISEDVTNSGMYPWAYAEDGITMKDTANYTLVDFTNGLLAPVVSQKLSGLNLFNTAYPSYVFVRVYDDELTDVVVYRYPSEDAVGILNFTGVITELVDYGETYIFTEAYEAPVDENCTFTDKDGNKTSGKDNIKGKLSLFEGKTLQNKPVLYRFTEKNGYITEIYELSPTHSFKEGEYEFDPIDYSINNIPVSWNANTILMTYTDDGKIVSAEESYADILMEGKGDVDFFVKDGTIELIIIYREKEIVPYGMVLAVAYESGLSDGYVMQVAMRDGTINEYDLSSKVTYTLADGATLAISGYLGKDDVAAAMIASRITGTTVPASTGGFGLCRLQSQYAADAMFNFTIKNGEITAIKEVENETDVYEYVEGNNKKYNAETMSYGAYKFDEDTTLFVIDEPKGYDVVTEDSIKVGSPSSFINNGDDGLNLIFFTESNKDAVTFAIGFALTTSIPEDSAAVIVTAVKTVAYNDDDAVEIKGIQAGEEVSYIIYNDEGAYSFGANPATIGKGDVVLVSTPGAEKVVEDFNVLVSANANQRTFTLMNGADLGDTSDDIYNTVAYLTDATGSKFFISDDVQNFLTPSVVNATWACASDGIVMQANSNYTLVDYTEGIRNPIIEKKTPGISLFNATKYDSQVFVRVYDDELKEVVVYRYEKI